MRQLVIRLARGVMAAVVVVVVAGGIGLPAHAQTCGNDAGGFDRWLTQYRSAAAAQGISQATLAVAFEGVRYDTTVIRLDRGQKSFKLSFEEFYARRVSESLLNRGRQRMQQHGALLGRIEQRFGVPAPILMAIWGLETNFGADGGGKFSIVQSIATLSYDCRRADFFREHLISALKIIERGDIPASEMRGGWAGEIGPMQFLPGSYFKHAVDFDGDGRRDLFRSVPDMLASTANFLKNHGWQAGKPWGDGTANYGVIRQWNKAEVYVRTIATMADRLGERRPEPKPQRTRSSNGT
jgi:lytic murein transglycosylase